ncbi:MAG: restriction endonuclease subunit S [Smithellaceae bacterium]|nr:restriction endonuclease subunit S [Smithellaceae bacterium]
MGTRHLWQETRLGDVVQIKHGWPFKSECFCQWSPGVPVVVNIGNFQYTGGFRFETTQLKGYSGEYPSDYQLAPGDILLVMTCQTPGGEILGIPGRIPNDGIKYLHNQRMGKVVVTRPDLIDLDYLYWVFLWQEFNQELVASSSGTKIVHTAPTRIEAFRFIRPSLNEQHAIARILRALHDKLALNRRMNRTLEAIAQALFHSWFIDFGPVTARREGRKPIGMDDATAALFPAHFQETDMGPIPAGWKAGSTIDIARYVNGKNFTKNASGTGRMVIRIAELNSGPAVSTIYNDVNANPENIAFPDDLLFSWSGSLDVYRWHRDAALVNQHIFKVVCEKYPQWFVHYHLQDAMTFFQGIAADKATTMGHIKREHLSQFDVALPPAELINAANRIIRPIYDRIHRNERQILSLAALRDTLLPQLLSGELRVGNAEKMIGKA